MKTSTASAVLAALLATAAYAAPVVDERFPYTGPKVPIGDWVDNTVNGNGKGFVRLTELPAVQPKHKKPTNNVNTIALAYVPAGMNIHYQTPFGLGEEPSVKWGLDPKKLDKVTKGQSHTYGRTPSCSMITDVTQCNEFFHDVQISPLLSDTTYYYQIPAANGTTASDVLTFKTARVAGDSREFSIAVLHDMGYTNAGGTYKQLLNVLDDVSFVQIGGDLSYADDWYSGILPCQLTGSGSWPVCSNGTSTSLPGNETIPLEYDKPLPAGEIPNQGGPQGGDMSVMYETNWDLWQAWMNAISMKVPLMVLPGNHEASCAEFDGPGNIMSAYLNENEPNTTQSKSNLTYYSCHPSQRNFTAFQHRFRMPGKESGGVGNFWHSFDYGLAHIISMDAETDFAHSPEWSFADDVNGDGSLPMENQTYPTDSGPFGAIDGSIYDSTGYQQYQWLQADLAKVDRQKTPWVLVISHRPMYSTASSSYQTNIRNAFEALFLKYGVDLYSSGHIHWEERMYPMGANGTIDTASIIDQHTYRANPGKSMTHVTNGMAGNIESHSTLNPGQSIKNITAFLDQEHYGFSKITFSNETALKLEVIRADDGGINDYLWLLKPEASPKPPGTC